MELTQEQQEKLMQTLKVAPVCPNCGYTGNASVNPDEYQLTTQERSGEYLSIDAPMRFMPLAAVVCPECAYVRLFNLGTLGIVNQ